MSDNESICSPNALLGIGQTCHAYIRLSNLMAQNTPIAAWSKRPFMAARWHKATKQRRQREEIGQYIDALAPLAWQGILRYGSGILTIMHKKYSLSTVGARK